MKIANSRPAATLVEVLIAIFCVSIGMISVLVLFPVGLQNMAEAVRENRLAQVAANAEAIADWAGIRTDTTVRDTARFCNTPIVFVDPIGFQNLGLGGTISASEMDDTNANYENNTRFLGRKRLKHVNVGPIVVDDPISGNKTTITVNQTATYRGIPRCTVSSAMAAAPVRFLALEDDITFGVNGQPTVTATQIERERRYSWGYLWRRSADSRVVDLSLIIYSGRKIAGVADSLTNEYPYRGPRSALANSPETEINTPVDKVFTHGLTVATVGWPVGQQAPPIKRGQWVFDASLATLSGTALMTNGYFYRIEGVSDIKAIGTPNILEYQQQIILDRPARADGFVAIFMPDVVAVIEKGNGKMPR